MLRAPALRASDADREAALDALRHASVDGRLTLEELGARTELAQVAATQRELSRVTEDLPPVGAPGPSPERERALLSSVRRAGRFALPASSRYSAVLGSVDLDLRRATLPGERADVEVRTLLGSARVRVPPGAAVEVTGGGLFCSRDVRLEGDAPVPGGPVVRIHIRGVLGRSVIVAQPRLGDRLADGARRLGAELRRP